MLFGPSDGTPHGGGGGGEECKWWGITEGGGGRPLYVYMGVCRWKDGGGEEGPHANNGIVVVDVALCLTLLLAGVTFAGSIVCLPPVFHLWWRVKEDFTPFDCVYPKCS